MDPLCIVSLSIYRDNIVVKNSSGHNIRLISDIVTALNVAVDELIIHLDVSLHRKHRDSSRLYSSSSAVFILCTVYRVFCDRIEKRVIKCVSFCFFSVLSFCCSQMFFFSFQVEEHLVCSLPRVALKIHFIKRHQERREETEANLFHSLSSSFFLFFFSICFQGLFCVYSTFHSHLLQQPLPFSKLPWNPSTRSPRRLKTKPFMGSQSLLRVATRRLPFRWMTYSNRSHCQTTGTIRKASVSY